MAVLFFHSAYVLAWQDAVDIRLKLTNTRMKIMELLFSSLVNLSYHNEAAPHHNETNSQKNEPCSPHNQTRLHRNVKESPGALPFTLCKLRRMWINSVPSAAKFTNN